MTDHGFDRIARLLSSAGSRRQALAALAALPLARAHPAFAASQIETAACGEAGAVCTELKGCCSELVCATSYTNPAYGVCVAGEGDMLPVSDDIVVPGAEGIEDELAQQVTDATVATADVPQTDSSLATQDADIQARKDARRSRKSTQQSRRRANHGDTHEKKLANQTEKRTAAQNKRDARALKRKPRIDLAFFEINDHLEILRVENRDDVSVVISSVESIKQPDVYSNQTVTIAAGKTHRLLSGDKAQAAQPTMQDSSVWSKEDVCPIGDGIVLTVTKSVATKKHQFTVPCPT